MEENEINELRNKIIEGLNKSAKLLLETKKKNNGRLVIFNDGKIEVINATDIKS